MTRLTSLLRACYLLRLLRPMLPSVGGFAISYNFYFFRSHLCLFPIQSGPQDQKSVIFSHSVISLNQLLKNSKNTANIFLTFRNRVKIFLSQNIMHNFESAVYRTNLSIRTDRTDKSVKTLIRLLEQSDQGLLCL